MEVLKKIAADVLLRLLDGYEIGGEHPFFEPLAGEVCIEGGDIMCRLQAVTQIKDIAELIIVHLRQRIRNRVVLFNITVLSKIVGESRISAIGKHINAFAVVL